MALLDGPVEASLALLASDVDVGVDFEQVLDDLAVSAFASEDEVGVASAVL